MSLLRGGVLLLGALWLSACDNHANPAFEQELKDRQEAAAGDPYAALEANAPQQYTLNRFAADQQQYYADIMANQFRGIYMSLLPKLEHDKAVDTSGQTYKSCRAAFEGAAAYAQAGGGGAGSAGEVPPRRKTIDALRDCRSSAKDAGGDAGRLLARFASAGVTMVGVKDVGLGQSVEGMKIWSQGYAWSREDKPGFELSLKSLSQG